MTATRSTRSSRPVRSLLPAAEVALAAVTLATVAGMWRLFEDGSFFWPLAAHGIAAHAVAAACRRRGLALPVSGLVTASAAILALSWGHLGDSTALGLPTAETLQAASDRLDEAWRLFDEVKAPAPVLPGFLIAAAAALWVGAWLADVAAFRLWTSFEALIPSGTLFVFASLFAADRGRAAAAALWLVTALAFVLLHRLVRQHGSPSWIGSDPRLGTRSLLRVGTVLVVAATALALVVGPRLPGADDEPIVAVRDLNDGGSSRETISPLVEIRSRLVDQSQTELFTVRTSQRSYWRLTSLDEFDGAIWKSRGSYEDADRDLADLGPPPPNAAEVTQEFTITALSALWLPAAFQPRSLVDAGDVDVKWDPESSTLIVPRGTRTSDGMTYEVMSAVPTDLQPEQLQGAGPPPDDIAEEGTALPPGFPTSVVVEAQRVVESAGATTPYEMARALQSYFQDGSFTYSLEVQPGHSDSAIEDFLFVNRTGYCEQFAATYAAMARAVGLPARVAVGFTPGIPDETEPDLYHVRGEHGHAWPEVWISGAGWIPFEPTPGRGAPFAAAYTGLEESQDTPGESEEPLQVPATVDPAQTETTTTLPGATTPTSGTGMTDITEPEPFTTSGDETSGTEILVWLGWTLLAAVALGVLAVLAGAAIAFTRLVQRWRRRVRAVTPEAKVRVAWADAVDAVGVTGAVPRRFETPVEYARRAAKAIGDTRPTPLAWLVEQADFAAEAVGPDDAEHAVELAHGIRDTVRARTTTRTRLLAAADPRPPHRRRAATGPAPSGPRIRITADLDPR